MISKKKNIGGSFTLEFETGRIAKQANGAVVGRCGDTVVISTVVMSNEDKESLDFFPLQVNYIEKYYAAGKIPGGYIKREGRPRDKELLVSRMIDRPIRPLFPKDLAREVQVSTMTVSSDPLYPPDILAIISSSLALTISDIPFSGPIGAVRVMMDENGDFTLKNPSYSPDSELEELDLVIVGKKDKILMLEGGFNEVKEEVLIAAMEWAKPFINDIIDFQNEFASECRKEKHLLSEKLKDEKFTSLFLSLVKDKMKKALNEKSKVMRNNLLNSLKLEAKAALEEEFSEATAQFFNAEWENLEYHISRDMILEEDIRPDGRKVDELRNLEVQTKILPRTHGSSLFTRGETQSLGTVTLGSDMDAQKVDDLGPESSNRFMLHYNFFPFSVGEIGKFMVGRREIGHGYLIYRSLLPILPSFEDFPYTIRVVSEILESNGSSSMASLSSASMALLDAGVPIKNSVAGIAMGLVTRDNEYRILTDIQGIEDYSGDMDLKVAGTRQGLTGIQLDIKLEGISYEIIKEALVKARDARLKILDVTEKEISKPKELSQYAPRVAVIQIPQDKIKDLVGPSGRTIRSISEKTSSIINFQDSGKTFIISDTKENLQKALAEIRKYTSDAEIGKVYDGIIKKVVDFGVFVEFLPSKEGLCHVSKLSNKKIYNIHELYKEGDSLQVKCLAVEQGKYVLAVLGVDTSTRKPSSFKKKRDFSSHNTRRREDFGDRRREDFGDRRREDFGDRRREDFGDRRRRK